MRTVIATIMICSASALLLSAAPALGDTVMSPRTFCKGGSPTTQGGIKNKDASKRVTVTCTGIRTSGGDSDGGSAYLRLTRSNKTGKTFACTLSSYDQSGTLLDSGSGSYSGTGSQSMVMNVGSSDGTGSVVGSYVVVCKVPAKSEIRTLFFDE